jgi:aryl-alcohol dehydrogenase-like predicted oxidoreductase
LGVVAIKALARGELLQNREPSGADSGLARDMIAFVLANKDVDCCICGVHSEAQVKENFSASWTPLTPEARKRLETLAAGTPCRNLAWLENGWLSRT